MLLRPAEQRGLLDSFGGLGELVHQVELVFATWQERLSERDALALSEQERAQRIDLYRFQKRELDAADVRLEEEAELELLLPQLKNGDRLKSVALEAHGILHAQESSATDLVGRVIQEVSLLRSLGAPLSDVAELLDGAAVHLAEVAQRLDTFASALDADPVRLEEVLSRLDVLGKIEEEIWPDTGGCDRLPEPSDRRIRPIGKFGRQTARCGSTSGGCGKGPIHWSSVLSEGRRACPEKRRWPCRKN